MDALTQFRPCFANHFFRRHSSYDAETQVRDFNPIHVLVLTLVCFLRLQAAIHKAMADQRAQAAVAPPPLNDD